jgi:hypothetical protein
MNDRLPVWIVLSIAKHFKDLLIGQNVYLEGQARDTSKEESWIEIRVDGPVENRVSYKHSKWKYEINLLIVTTRNDNVARIHELCGIAQPCFKDSIPIYRYGSDNGDDGTLYGCLRLIIGFRERIVTSIFGNVNPTTNLLQACIEGHYEIDVEKDHG